MNEQLDKKFESIYRANPDGLQAYMSEIADSVRAAIGRQNGVFTEKMLLEEARKSMPNAANLGICPALADGIARRIISNFIEILSSPNIAAESELKMLGAIAGAMEKRGFQTAGEAIGHLRKRQLN